MPGRAQDEEVDRSRNLHTNSSTASIATAARSGLWYSPVRESGERGEMDSLVKALRGMSKQELLRGMSLCLSNARSLLKEATWRLELFLSTAKLKGAIGLPVRISILPPRRKTLMLRKLFNVFPTPDTSCCLARHFPRRARTRPSRSRPDQLRQR